MAEPRRHHDPRYRFQQVAYRAVTPIHVGAGQDVGIVDLPVIRERTTGHPFLPGSGIRGALRDRCQEPDEDRALVRRLFGAEVEDEGELSSGCVSVLDAHLVLFPVRSVPGVYHYLTSPFVLRRWQALRAFFLDNDGGPPVPDGEPAEGRFAGGAPGIAELSLEEYPFRRAEAPAWQWPEGLLGVASSDVVLLADADFRHFLHHATLVRQRNRLSTAKTVLDGALFSVEAVPAEAQFVGFLGTTLERGDAEREARMSAEESTAALRRLLAPDGGQEAHLVLGGDESVGWGITRLTWEQAQAAAPAARAAGAAS